MLRDFCRRGPRILLNVKTVVLGDPPPAVASLIAERQRLGLDTHDEVWNGEYHMAPAPSFKHANVGSTLNRFLGIAADARGLLVSLEFNLGGPTNFRVPDLGVHRGDPEGVWLPTAAMVVEVRSPDDESLQKFDHYFDHRVEEVLIADITANRVQLYLRGETAFVAATVSDLLGFTTDEIEAALGWAG